MNTCYSIYHIKTRQSIICNTISVQCFSELTSSICQYKFLLSLPVVSSLTMTVTEKIIDMTLESGITEDAISGREKLFKNFIYNAFV